MSRITRALLALVLLALALPAGAQAAPSFVPLVSGHTFAAPTFAAAPPRDPSRMFVVERAGRIQIVRGGVLGSQPFLDISGDVDTSGERGLLSMTFAPDYEQSGRFYVYMVARDPVGEIQVREYRRSAGDPDVADPAGRIVFRATHNQAGNHNGGQVEWGPDGFLWLATGDGGGSNDGFGHARDLASPLGKMLRIDPRPGNADTYSVPADNPFGTAVWAYGLRNPFRFSFDRETGDLLIGDVGQGTREEIDWATAASGLGRGGDYGWACREGSVTGPKTCSVGANYIPPIFDYDSTAGAHSVTGGYVVRDPGLPTLRGRYLYVDFYDGDIRSIRLAPGATDDQTTQLSRMSVASFGEDACGHIYVVSLNGSVERIQDGPPGACVLKPQPPPLPQPQPEPQPQPQPPASSSSAPGAAGGGHAGTAGSPDRTAPRIELRVARKGRVGRRATPRILVTASENCRVTVNARLAKTSLKRVRTPLLGGRRTTIRLRPRARAVRKIRRALRRHKRVTMAVRVDAVDAAGNRRHLARRLKVRRA